jgi:ketosteroid isomerase-like protein
MYHILVRRIAHWAFEQLNTGHYEAILDRCAPQVQHTFAGDHALGGSRQGIPALRHWFQRLYRLFPTLQFEIVDVLVRGWPWNTRVVVRWIDRAHLAGDLHYENTGVHALRLRWGRLTHLRAYLDTQIIAATCAHLAAQGIAEAAAPPLTN